jgi:hypothetical protein
MPLSFYKEAKAHNFVMCKQIFLKNPQRAALYYQKIYGYYFTINLVDPKKIQKHLFDTLCYNMLRKFEKFDE